MYTIYACIDSEWRVIGITTSKYKKNPGSEWKSIGETEDPDVFYQYTVYDEIGASNYKYVDGELVERTEEEKAPDRKIIQYMELQQRYIPSFRKSLISFLEDMIKREWESYNADMKIKMSGIYQDWSQGKYEVGDIRTNAGQVWECWTAHDNAIYPDITPDNPQTWANFWRPLHGKSPETARPWTKPYAGTTDMYHAGEYMVWTDGTIKKCLRDTVYSPEEYAADWEDAE